MSKSHWLENWYGQESNRRYYWNLLVGEPMSDEEKSLY